MGFDYGEFEKFTKRFNKMTIEFNKFLFRFLTDISLETLENTKKRTPVDTGELRRSFEVTRVIRKGDELIVYLHNNKDYASLIEFGHKTKGGSGWVEGAYMATISLEEIERKIPKKFQLEFAKFMKGLGMR